MVVSLLVATCLACLLSAWAILEARRARRGVKFFSSEAQADRDKLGFKIQAVALEADAIESRVTAIEAVLGESRQRTRSAILSIEHASGHLVTVANSLRGYDPV